MSAGILIPAEGFDQCNDHDCRNTNNGCDDKKFKRDQQATAMDALRVINELSRRAAQPAAAEMWPMVQSRDPMSELPKLDHQDEGEFGSPDLIPERAGKVIGAGSASDAIANETARAESENILTNEEGTALTGDLHSRAIDLFLTGQHLLVSHGASSRSLIYGSREDS